MPDFEVVLTILVGVCEFVLGFTKPLKRVVLVGGKIGPRGGTFPPRGVFTHKGSELFGKTGKVAGVSGGVK
jgi:hypothetical protein